MDLRRISQPPTLEQKLNVVSLAKLKAHARIRHADEDELIKDYIATAFDFLDGLDGWLNGYCLLAGTFQADFDSALDDIEIPARPLIDGGNLVFALRGDNGEYDTIATTAYASGLRDGFTHIYRLGTTPYPMSAISHPAAYRIIVTAGHVTAADVPQPLKQAILMLATHFYAHREVAREVGQGNGVPREVEYGLIKLAGRYRISPDHS